MHREGNGSLRAAPVQRGPLKGWLVGNIKKGWGRGRSDGTVPPKAGLVGFVAWWR